MTFHTSPTFLSTKWCEKISALLSSPSYCTSPSQVTITVDCSPAISGRAKSYISNYRARFGYLPATGWQSTEWSTCSLEEEFGRMNLFRWSLYRHFHSTASSNHQHRNVILTANTFMNERKFLVHGLRFFSCLNVHKTTCRMSRQLQKIRLVWR